MSYASPDPEYDRMNPMIAAAMAACLQHMSGGAWERDFEDCDRITIEYN